MSVNKNIAKLAQEALVSLYGANLIADGKWGPKSETAMRKLYLKEGSSSPNDASDIKSKIQSIVNIFETGTPTGNYADISIYDDGPSGIKQTTFGRSGSTEFSTLKYLVEMYAEEDGLYSDEFKSYVGRVGCKPSLYNDSDFINLLKKSGSDPVMKATQDKFFDQRYWDVAKSFFDKNGFEQPLSMLVIFDSVIHGGLAIVRKKFSEKPPVSGGDEKRWVSDYTHSRYNWLKYHPRTILRNTAKRPKFYKSLIESGNWGLDKEIKLQGFSL